MKRLLAMATMIAVAMGFAGFTTPAYAADTAAKQTVGAKSEKKADTIKSKKAKKGKKAKKSKKGKKGKKASSKKATGAKEPAAAK